MDEEKPKMTEAQVEELRKAIAKQNEKEFESMDNPFKSVYVDIEFLQDFRLGALIKLISTQVEYDYILSRLPIYGVSHGEPITSFFPDLGFKEEQVDAYLDEPRNWPALAMDSPFRASIQDMTNMIEGMQQHNLLVHYDKPIELYVGCTTLLYSMEARRRLAMVLDGVLNEVNMTFIPTSLYEFEGVDIDEYDVYMVASANKLINCDQLVKKFEKMEMTDKVIIALEEMDTTDEELADANSTKEQALESTVEFANIFTRFSFVKRVILV